MLGRTSSEVFVMLLFFASFLCLHFIFDLHFVVVLHLSMFFIHICFSTSSLTLLCGLSPGVYTHFIFSAQPIAEWFATLSFSTIPLSSYRERYGFEWALFYPQALFYLTLLHWHFTCVYQGLPGSRQFFLEVCRASYWSSKHRPGPSACLIKDVI